MAQDFRHPRAPHSNEWRDTPRGDRYDQGSDDRDQYRSGDERRFTADESDRFDDPGGSYRADRSYSQGGYAEQTDRYTQRDRDPWSGAERDARQTYRRESQYEPRPQERGGYARAMLQWNDADEPRYFGTGVHTGGSYGTAPGSLVSGAGAFASESPWRDDDPRSADFIPGGAYTAMGRTRIDTGWSGERRTSLQARSDTARVSHRGRGPKGYVRSEERLREMICECLTDDPWVDASDVSIEVSGQTVKLSGTVAERRAKHRIEDLIEQFGVRDIDNQIRVASRPDSGRSTYSPPSRGGRDTAANENAAAASTSAATGAPSTKRS